MVCYPNLREFIRPVPVYPESARVATVAESLVDADLAVVVRDHSPWKQRERQVLGLVTAKRLLSVLKQAQAWDRPLSEFVETAVESVPVIPVDRGLDRLVAVAPDWYRSSVEAIVVDSEGIVLGLLDRPRLSVAALACFDSLDNSLPLERLPPEYSPVNFIARLLDRLPFPCQLQTASGEVLSQNRTWHHCWESLNDRDETAETCSPDVFNTLLRDRDTYICSGRTKTGDRQLWQLIRVSLSDLAVAPAQPKSQIALATLSASLPLSTAAGVAIPSCNQVPSPPDEPDALWLICARDVTDTSQHARELTAKNADLVHLDRLKTELLTCVSHELKTPLTALLGLSNLLRNPNLGTLNERQAKYARLIYRSSREMMTVVNQLCDLTQLEKGELTLNRQRVDVRECGQIAYQQVLQLCDLESSKPFDCSILPPFSLHVAPEAETVVADRSRLGQILTALLLNAVQRTPTDGEIELRVERWNGWIAFVVKDTGIGIRADVQPFVFQSYQRVVEALTLENADPTGLGLVLAQRLARLHGGEIDFTSKERYGSQFTLLLPARDRDARPSNPLTAERRNLRFILVVDGDSERVETLISVLRDDNYRVLLARSGPEALAKARQLQPHAIFLNPMLPILSGWDVLTLLKADANTRDLPVILISDTDTRPTLPKTVEAWMGLPVDRTVLTQTLDRLLATSNAEPPLTVLWLNLGDTDRPSLSGDLDRLFHQHHCRVVEVDDLEQADILAKVWKPDVVLLDRTGPLDDSIQYLEQFVRHRSLARLPLVTLDTTTTAAANRVFGECDRPLRVFPCLTAPDTISEESGLPVVLEVVRIAAKFQQ
ncbi:MAG: response regulator [Cyanobacteria bacterium SID2]|nr:response regulator [Cyanobacteria bacterium SID2]MBP0006178.1 response regulator [Cyanobacteria bacterium SBC]